MRISSYRYLAYILLVFVVVVISLALTLQFLEIVVIEDPVESVFGGVFVGFALLFLFAVSMVVVSDIVVRGFLIVCHKLSRRGSIYLGEVFFDSSMPSLANLEHAIEINSFLPKSWSKAVFESLKRVGIV